MQPRGLPTIGALSSERGGGLGISASTTSTGLMGSISSSLSGMSGRGARGSSIDRGRGRARGVYHSTLGNYQRSSLYEEENRTIAGRTERAWPERNGTTPTDTDWNASAAINPSPRKDFSALRSNASGESWRRSRIEDDELGPNVNGEGWRMSGPNNSMYKWRMFRKFIQSTSLFHYYVLLFLSQLFDRLVGEGVKVKQVAQRSIVISLVHRQAVWNVLNQVILVWAQIIEITTHFRRQQT